MRESQTALRKFAPFERSAMTSHVEFRFGCQFNRLHSCSRFQISFY